jgi:hypothetical protein
LILGFGICLLYLWPLTLHPNSVPYPPNSEFTDLLITHLPNAEYIRDSLMRYGQWPLWNAQLFAGQPFAADPLAGLWYPPNSLLWVLPLPFAFNLLFILHLAFAGYGLYRFLRAEGLTDGPALLGGLAFCGTPKLIAHIGAGHVSLVFAVAWTPWLLLAIKRAAMEDRLKRSALAGAVLALIFLADVRWAFYAAVLGGAYALVCFAPLWRQLPTYATAVKSFPAFTFIFLSLSAILALPLVEFIRLSNRRALTLADAATFSLPPFPYLLGLIIPNLGGFHEYMTYVGVVPLLLAFFGVNRRTLFWLVSVGVAIAFSLGSNFFLFPLLFRLVPGLGFLRVPPRAWFIVALGICILAAHGLQFLLSNLWPRYARLPRSPALLLPVIILLMVLDLVRVDSTLIVARPRPPRLAASEWIAAQLGTFRVYSPSYSLPAGDGLQHLDGVDPLQLAATVKFVEAASGVRATRYSVTLPAFEADDVTTANAGAIPDARLLGLLNVKYVAAEFPLTAPGLVLAQTFGRTQIFENTGLAARAWVEPAADGLALGSPTVSESGETAEIKFWSPNRIEVRATGPGRLVLSEVMYPGWRATVDGVSVSVETADGLLRSVALVEGAHEIIFDFQPVSVYLGAAITLLGLLVLLGLWLWRK